MATATDRLSPVLARALDYERKFRTRLDTFLNGLTTMVDDAIRDGTALETIETIECIREALSKSDKLLPALVPDLDDAVRRLREEAG